MSFETHTISHGDVKAEVTPARGAIVTGLRVGAQEVLYLDRATLEDPTKNVRGGIPVLFPYAGKLIDELFVHAKTKMKQHGFGRNKNWAVTEKTPSMLRVTLQQDDETRAQYPYEFTAEQSVSILPRGLLVEMMICNNGPRPLPVSPGWHPYFVCTGAKKGEVSGDVPGLSSDKFGNDKEFDFGLPAPKNGRANFSVPGLGKLRLSFAPEMRHMQFWSQPGKDFICLEPFTGPNNTVNTDKRIDIPAGEARAFWMRMELMG